MSNRGRKRKGTRRVGGGTERGRKKGEERVKFIFMSYFGKKGQSDAMKIMS